MFYSRVSLCEHVWLWACGISRYALNTRSDFCVVLKCGWEVLAESYHEEGKSRGTKWGVRFR